MSVKEIKFDHRDLELKQTDDVTLVLMVSWQLNTLMMVRELVSLHDPDAALSIDMLVISAAHTFFEKEGAERILDWLGVGVPKGTDIEPGVLH